MTTPIDTPNAQVDAARVVRTNNVLGDLIREGKADVTDLTLRDVMALAAHLGWQGTPRVEFVDGVAFISAPRRRRNRNEGIGTALGVPQG